MGAFAVNQGRAESLAQSIAGLNYLPDSFEEMTPFRDDPFRERHFIFFLAAIDHNTHGAQRYQAVIDGAPVHGSDLMYWLAKQAAIRDPDTFTPQRLERVSAEELGAIFASDAGLLPVGMERRAALLRDAAHALCASYGGDLNRLFARAGGYLRREDGRGILALLSEIRAYQDPLEKKSFLLVKLLRRRGLLELRDPERMKVPVDHVLFTVALRSGLVQAEADTAQMIVGAIPLDEQVVRDLRAVTLEAYDLVSRLAGLPVDLFDDLLWAYGRECLKYPAPFSAARLGEIRIALDVRVRSRVARDQFLMVINGLDQGAPEGARLYPVPVFPDTWFF